MRNKKVELLAPAGNAEAFYGAVHAGADAIYLGGNRFGARAYAENFSEDELEKNYKKLLKYFKNENNSGQEIEDADSDYYFSKF